MSAKDSDYHLKQDIHKARTSASDQARKLEGGRPRPPNSRGKTADGDVRPPVYEDDAPPNRDIQAIKPIKPADETSRRNLPGTMPELPRPPGPIDLRLQKSFSWEKAKNQCEANRRKLEDLDPFQSVLTSHCFLADATRSSFALDGMDISANDAIVALDSFSAHKSIRSRNVQRIRNHVAALRTVDARVRHKQQLTTANFMRWYISLGCGLCPSTPDPSGIARIDQQIQQIISPELRFKAAIGQIVKLQISRTLDPLVPSFNGILSRLLLRYHLGRCGLPPIIFPEGTTEKMLTSERKLTNLILECVDSSYAMLIVSNAKH